jgi:hypothetical protein
MEEAGDFRNLLGLTTRTQVSPNTSDTGAIWPQLNFF